MSAEIGVVTGVTRTGGGDDSAPARSGWSLLLAWGGLYLVFFAIPLIAIYLGCSAYIADLHRGEISGLIQSQQRNLISLRSKVGGQKALIHRLGMFGQQLRMVLNQQSKIVDAMRKLNEDLPPGARVAIWNTAGEVFEFADPDLQLDPWIVQLCTLIAGFDALEIPIGEEESFRRAFASQHPAVIASVTAVLGADFPLFRLFDSPGQVLMQRTSDQQNQLVWVRLTAGQRPIGGFLAVIPSRGITETLGLKYLLFTESNPRFSFGFIDLEDPDAPYLAERTYFPVADPLLKEFVRTRRSPVVRSDWMLGTIPLSDFSSVRLFCLSKTQVFREDREFNDLVATGILLLLLLLGALAFTSFGWRQARLGISIRYRVVGLFLLATFLPLALLAVAALHLTQDRTRVLTQDHALELQDGIHQLDDGFPEFIRNQRSWLRGFRGRVQANVAAIASSPAAVASEAAAAALDAVAMFDVTGHCWLHWRTGEPDPVQQLLFERLSRAALAEVVPQAFGPDVPRVRESESLLVAGMLGKHGQLQSIGIDTDQAGLLYYDVLPTGPATSPVVLIAFSRRLSLERRYLTEQLCGTAQRADFTLFALDRETGTQSIPPTLSGAFKANIRPMWTLSLAVDSLPPERVMEENDRYHLVTLVRGRSLEAHVIGAYMPWERMFGSIQTIYVTISVLLIFTLAAVIVLAVALSRSVINPITEVVDGTRRVAGGDLNHVLAVREQDEIGHLAVAFNDMSRRLKNRLYEMTTLYQISQAASISTSPREVFEMTVGLLAQHLGSTRTGIAWVREEDIKKGESPGVYLADEPDGDTAARVLALTERGFAEKESVIDHGTPGQAKVLLMPICYEENNFAALYMFFAPGWPGVSNDEIGFVDTLRHQLSMYVEKSRLFEQAISDGLTRLYVRRFFLANLEKEIARSCRYGVEMSLLMMDIDHFKKFNDSYGHQAGDLVLRETAQRIMDSVRNVDIPGRYGGEELALILPSTGMAQAVKVAERIRSTIAGAAYQYEQHSLKVTVSIGVTSLVGRTRVTLEEFINEADAALYEAKHGGRNRVVAAVRALELDAARERDEAGEIVGTQVPGPS